MMALTSALHVSVGPATDVVMERRVASAPSGVFKSGGLASHKPPQSRRPIGTSIFVTSMPFDLLDLKRSTG